MKKRALKILYWSPRVLAILFCLFISIFALDAFDTPGSIWLKIAAFLIHLIPSYVMITLTVVAWKWETIGGILFFIPAIVFAILIIARQNSLVAIPIALPPAIIGALFIWNGRAHKKQPYKKRK